MGNQDIRLYVREKFAEYSGLTDEELFAEDATLAMVMARSPRMTNSIDLMEAMARTSNAVRKEYGIRVRLPALPLETPTSTVLDVFVNEVAQQKSAAA